MPNNEDFIKDLDAEVEKLLDRLNSEELNLLLQGNAAVVARAHDSLVILKNAVFAVQGGTVTTEEQEARERAALRKLADEEADDNADNAAPDPDGDGDDDRFLDKKETVVAPDTDGENDLSNSLKSEPADPKGGSKKAPSAKK